MGNIDVYWNTHKNTFSLRQRGKVIGHSCSVMLKDCFFVVGGKGRERVLSTGRKNVHAFVRGEFIKDTLCASMACLMGGFEVGYNPLKGDSFVREEGGENVSRADLCLLTIDNRKPCVYAFNGRVGHYWRRDRVNFLRKMQEKAKQSTKEQRDG